MPLLIILITGNSQAGANARKKAGVRLLTPAAKIYQDCLMSQCYSDFSSSLS
jgi:hypothetical protein